MEDLERQIPYSLEETWSQIPGVCRGGGGGGGGGGMMKFRIDRYIIVCWLTVFLSPQPPNMASKLNPQIWPKRRWLQNTQYPSKH
jgi:hypothetical protein